MQNRILFFPEKEMAANLSNEVEELYSKLNQLREQHGFLYKIPIGKREPFAHEARLDLDQHLLDLGKQIFSDLTEDFPLSHERHHPYLLMLNTVTKKWEEDEIELLPGENYEVLQDGEKEVLRIIKNGTIPQKYTVTPDQLVKFTTLFQINLSSAEGQRLRKLAVAYS